MNGQEALADRIADALRARPELVVLGEDVADGGLFGLTRVAAQAPDLADRLASTPLVPGSLLAHAAGLALGGRHPLVLMPSAASLLDGFGDLLAVTDPGPWAAMAGPPRLSVVVPTGSGLGLAEDVGRPVEALLAALPGLALLSVGTACGLLAAFDALVGTPGPAALLVPRTLLLASLPDDRASLDPSGLRTHQTGARATVFAVGAAVGAALDAAAGLDVTVAEPWRLRPFPTEAIARAARTGHVVVAAPGPESFTAERIAATVARDAVYHLDAPVEIVRGDPPPLGPAAEHLAVPSVASIRAALAAVGVPVPSNEKGTA